MPVEQEISDIELYSADSECMKSVSSERLDCEAIVKDETPPKNVVFKEFSKSTLKRFAIIIYNIFSF